MSLQLEDGHTRINNEVLEQLVKRGLLGSEVSLIFFVIRKTWGWGKKEDIISLTQFEKGLNLSRHTVIDTIKNLVLKKILVKRSIPDRQEIAYKFNKYWKEWLVNPTALVQNKMTTSAVERLKLVKRSAHTKETTKENKKGLEIIARYREQIKAKTTI
jgi:phage replication O-like protein O